MRFKFDMEESSDDDAVAQTDSKSRDKLAEKVCICFSVCMYVFAHVCKGIESMTMTLLFRLGLKTCDTRADKVFVCVCVCLYVYAATANDWPYDWQKSILACMCTAVRKYSI